MPQPSPESPVARRLRLVRRRIAAGALATFVAAWLAVAALGKGGSTSSTVTNPAPTTGTPSQSDDGTGAPSGGESQDNGFGPPQSGEDAGGGGASSGADSGSSQSSGRQ